MTRRAAATLGALFGPLVITTIYLSLSRWPERWFTTESDHLALGLAILAGLIALWSLPMRASHRVIASLGYVPAMGTLLVIAALSFVCGTFGDCL